jgi:hypothetical protein
MIVRHNMISYLRKASFRHYINVSTFILTGDMAGNVSLCCTCHREADIGVDIITVERCGFLFTMIIWMCGSILTFDSLASATARSYLVMLLDGHVITINTRKIKDCVMSSIRTDQDGLFFLCHQIDTDSRSQKLHRCRAFQTMHTNGGRDLH